VDEDGLFVEGSIFEHCDDVWREVIAKGLNKFSIYGRRRDSSPQCKVDPSLRTSPCITKALELWSISVVGDNAINDGTFLEVVKSFTESYKNQHILIKSVDTNSSLIHVTMDGTMPEDDKDEKKEEMEKADETLPPVVPESPLEKSEGNTSSILDRLGKVESVLQQLVDSDKQVHSEMGKGEEMTETEEKKEEVEKCNDLTKKADESVEAVSQEDLIQKAVTARVDEITKAFGEKITALEAKIETMEKEKIEKGGKVVIIEEIAGKVHKSAMVSNMEALGGI
jgi:hypothetical protein